MTQSKEKIEQATQKAAQDAADMARQGAEAFMKSGSIFMKGYEDMMRTAVELSQQAAEKQTKFMQDAMSSKTLHDLTTVQSKMAQTSFDDFMSGATKMSELSTKILSESVEPVNAQMSQAVEKTKKAMAA